MTFINPHGDLIGVEQIEKRAINEFQPLPAKDTHLYQSHFHTEFFLSSDLTFPY